MTTEAEAVEASPSLEPMVSHAYDTSLFPLGPAAATQQAIDGLSSNSLSQILQIFNDHHETLSCLENTIKKIESEVETVGRRLQQAGI